MKINLTPEQEKIVKEEFKTGHFRTTGTVTRLEVVSLPDGFSAD